MAFKWGFSDQQQQFAALSAKIAADNVTTFAMVKPLKPAYWRLSAAWNMIANAKDPAATNARTGPYAANSGKGVTIFEIWNEQNQADFWGAGAPNPGVYTEYLKSAHTKIKAVSGLSGSNSKVLFGGMQHIARNAFQDQWAFAGLPEIVFLQKCYDYATSQSFSLGSYFDVMCEHIYTQTDNVAYGGSVVGPAPSSSTDNLLQLVAIRALMVAQGDSAKNIWITEAGFSTATLTEAVQSTYMQDLFTYLAGLSYVETVLIYNVRDVDSNSTAVENRDGVMKTNFTPKTVWSWLTTFAPTTGTGGASMSATATTVDITTTGDLNVRIQAQLQMGQKLTAATAVGVNTSASVMNLTNNIGGSTAVGVTTSGSLVVNGMSSSASVEVTSTGTLQVLTMSGSTSVGIQT
jgi:hypothetical protein